MTLDEHLPRPAASAVGNALSELAKAVSAPRSCPCTRPRFAPPSRRTHGVSPPRLAPRRSLRQHHAVARQWPGLRRHRLRGPRRLRLAHERRMGRCCSCAFVRCAFGWRRPGHLQSGGPALRRNARVWVVRSQFFWLDLMTFYTLSFLSAAKNPCTLDTARLFNPFSARSVLARKGSTVLSREQSGDSSLRSRMTKLKMTE